MKKRFKLIFPIIAMSFSLTGCDLFNKKAELKIDDPYYQGYDYTKTGTKLQQELQKLCFDKHVKWVSYADVSKAYSYTETTEEKGSSYERFYTGKIAASYDTREHVWPCAQSANLWVHNKEVQNVHNVDLDKYVGGGSDLHHIRACTSSVNTARGDSRFTDFDDSTSVAYDKRDSVLEYGDKGHYVLKIQGYEGTNAAPKFANFAEPADEMKGDVARVILYVYIHYGFKNQEFEGSIKSGSLTYKKNDMIGDLSLLSIMGYKNNKRCQQVLQEWNKMDPPSAVEKLRNNQVQKIQGNRNPFVDYPEIADFIF